MRESLQVLSKEPMGDYREARADDLGRSALIEDHRAQPFGSQVVSMVPRSLN